MTASPQPYGLPEPDHGVGGASHESRMRAAVSALRTAGPPLLVLPLVKLLLHLQPPAAGYGYHRDELYYLACADHLGFGYVDHPPFSILVLAAVRAVLGDSIGAIRVVSAVAGAAMVALVGSSSAAGAT